jgi:gluconolactonase
MPGRVVCTLPGFQWLDSLAVEESGRICVATLWHGGITVFEPGGEYEHLPTPDVITTNLCFGGAERRDTWITCSSTGKLYRCRWPRPGLKLAFNA